MSDTGKDIGTVKIADDVVARIAALAALEVDGVSALAGGYTSGMIEKINRGNLGKGAKVSLDGREAVVDLSIMMGYSYNIQTTCQQVQTKVKTAIQNMTGLNVTDVNVRIAGITMPEA